MKKIFAIALAALVGTLLSAGNFRNTIGVGGTFPVTSLSGEFEGGSELDITQAGAGFDLTWLGVNTRNGLTFKVDIGGDFLSSDDFEGASDPDSAWEAGIAFGAGYSFMRTDRLTLAVPGMLGVTYGEYSWDLDYPMLFHWFDYLTMNIGADVLAKYQFTRHFGVFASLGFRFEFGELMEHLTGMTIQGALEDNVTVTGFRFVPTVGLSWTF